ncbi:MAG TPA: HPF/RaiA family ribosome-associated protein [Usitatibacter sp.]|nr:HPF/RaiA family ribosome-associated protein [Usitatibacter sp.]
MKSTQITLRNVRRSTPLSARIRELAERLEEAHPTIQGCRVLAEQQFTGPNRAGAFRVTVRVRMPGRELVAAHEHADDVFVAVRSAFAAMRRELEAGGGASPSQTPQPQSEPTTEVPS